MSKFKFIRLWSIKLLTDLEITFMVKSFHLSIIIRQEYRQEHRNGKEESHADNKEQTKVPSEIAYMNISKMCYLPTRRKNKNFAM